jgi:hypothetical protein
MPEANNHPIGENSRNLDTLIINNVSRMLESVSNKVPPQQFEQVEPFLLA